MTRLPEQVTPQVKCVVLGAEHGSVEKFQVARQEVGGMDAGFTADLKAIKAEMSPGEVVESTVKMEKMKKKVSINWLGMVKMERGKATT